MAVQGNFVCGHCGTTSARAKVVDLEPRNYRTLGAFTWSVIECAACGLYTAMGDRGISTFYFPAEGRARVSNLDKVPELIRADYEEALGCMVEGLFKAASAMARRTVQGVCRERGADPDLKLYDQIEELASKGELTTRLAKLAHEVRGFGNAGAHPRDDDLDEVTPEDAGKAMDFLEHLLQHIYII